MPPKEKKTAKTAEDKLNALFNEFADEEDTEIIGMDGIEKLCGQVGISDAGGDVRALVLCWKLGGCTVEPLKPGCIKRAEFTGSMHTMRKDSIKALAQMLPSLETGFMENKEFQEFFRFVHKFSREDGTQKKFLEKSFVVDLLPIVLDTTRAPHLTLFLEFLATQPDTMAISSDQWESFLMFNTNVSLDMDGYDDSSAWPVLLDEYVEWREEKDGKKYSS